MDLLTVKLSPIGWVIVVFVTAFLAVGLFKLFVQTLPYEKMKQQITSIPIGVELQEAKTRIDRGPEVSCSSVTECKKKLGFYYSRYAPDPTKNIRGPVLVYRMAGVDHIHCLYFDEENRLTMVADSTGRR